MMKWWKYLCVVLLLFVSIGGLLLPVPRLNILNETIRNVYFHVPVWFGMIAMMSLSGWYAIKYLRTNNMDNDLQSVEFANTGLVLGLLGYVTGAIWGNYAWGDPLPRDPKILSAAAGMLLYLAYWLLRSSFRDDLQRARISAIYNVFAFATFIPLVFVLPRLTDSLHPGNGGNPAFGQYDMDDRMRMVFYPACVGMILLGYWISTLRIRLRRVVTKIEDLQESERV
ncbi:MAG: cytochrome c biogenesis protein [Cytophagaceae bacterium]|nr:cytochrome c biogenesis protein [Cytophagaceae bacterium]